MTLREVLCQALNTGARGEGGCSTPSITRGNEIRPTPGAMHATDNLTRGNETGNQHRQRENIASHEKPTTSYEARKSASTAGASHDTTCPPKTPHAEAHTPAGAPSPTQTRPRTQKTAGTRPFGPAPTVRASRAPAQSQHKASEKLAETSASPDQSIGVASSFQTSFA